MLNRKVRNIGLCEALVNFTKTFHPDRLCQAVHTDRKRQVFLEPEPNIWMVLVGQSWNERGRVYTIQFICISDSECSVDRTSKQWRENSPIFQRPCPGERDSASVAKS